MWACCRWSAHGGPCVRLGGKSRVVACRLRDELCVCRDDRSALLWLQSISRGDAGKAWALAAVVDWTKGFAGQPQRLDLEAIVASGLFDECASAVAAVAAAGVEGLRDTNHTCALGFANSAAKLSWSAQLRSKDTSASTSAGVLPRARS